jgi:hypothetical protein
MSGASVPLTIVICWEGHQADLELPSVEHLFRPHMAPHVAPRS